MKHNKSNQADKKQHPVKVTDNKQRQLFWEMISRPQGLHVRF